MTMTSTERDGKLIETEDGIGVRFERRLAHPPERVWQAVTQPEELAAWFPDTIEGEFAAGAEVRFPKFAEMGLPAVGTVTEYDPPRLLAFTWGTSALRFELEPDGDGCRLVFTDMLPREASADRRLVGGVDDEQGVLPIALADRPTQDDEPLLRKSVHERSVLRPPLLLAPRARVIPGGSLRALYQEVVGHGFGE